MPSEADFRLPQSKDKMHFFNVLPKQKVPGTFCLWTQLPEIQSLDTLFQNTQFPDKSVTQNPVPRHPVEHSVYKQTSNLLILSHIILQLRSCYYKAIKKVQIVVSDLTHTWKKAWRLEIGELNTSVKFVPCRDAYIYIYI